MSREVAPGRNEEEPTWWERNQETLLNQPFTLQELKKRIDRRFEAAKLAADTMVRAGSDPGRALGKFGEETATARRLLNEMSAEYEGKAELSIFTILPLLRKWFSEFEANHNELFFKVFRRDILQCMCDVVIQKRVDLTESLADDREYLRSWPQTSEAFRVSATNIDIFFDEFLADKIIAGLENRTL